MKKDEERNANFVAFATISRSSHTADLKRASKDATEDEEKVRGRGGGRRMNSGKSSYGIEGHATTRFRRTRARRELCAHSRGKQKTRRRKF